MTEESARLPTMPSIIYGTAFKDEETKSLVTTALEAGFRAVDTSGNKPQYQEALVGQGIAAAIDSGIVTRADLFIQTKFSPYKAGKDPALYPYDTSETILEQVQQSISSSLTNLGVDYVDCLVLHSLYPSMEDTITAWKAMETLVPTKVSRLGLSNIDARSLHEIYEAATIKPCSVQNRLTGDTTARPEANLPPGLPYPETPYDRDVRSLCGRLNITYVPWGVLWGNTSITDDDPKQMLDKTAQEIGVSKQAVWYACLKDLGGCEMSILCGTTKETTMHDVLRGLARINDYLQQGEDQRKIWTNCVDHIRSVVNDD